MRQKDKVEMFYFNILKLPAVKTDGMRPPVKFSMPGSM